MSLHEGIEKFFTKVVGKIGLAAAGLGGVSFLWNQFIKHDVPTLLVYLFIGVAVCLVLVDIVQHVVMWLSKKKSGKSEDPEKPPTEPITTPDPRGDVDINRIARCHTVIVNYCKAAAGTGSLPNEITLTLNDKTLGLREFWESAFLLQVGAQTMGGDLKIVTDTQGKLNCIRLENAWKHVV